jgi:uncharacterized membrane protein
MKHFKLIFIFALTFIFGVIVALLFSSEVHFYQNRSYMMHNVYSPMTWSIYVPLVLLVGMFLVSLIYFNKQMEKSNVKRLKERLAEGELSIDEYNELRRNIL